MRWIFQKTEESNFNYKITPQNKLYLANFVASVTGCDVKSAQDFFLEIESNVELKAHFGEHESESKARKRVEIDYARRIGWYAFIRAAKPKLVVETGVDNGVGSCVIAAALIRNSDDGFSGRYIGTEINKNAGKYFSGIYSTIGEIRYGDSIELLKEIREDIDLFINDSDHDVDYEFNEYMTIRNKLSPQAIILGDNSHVSNSLVKFSNENGRSFLFFQEKPEEHWYPGAGVGISYVK
jgi:predicted O-methyltransferase YrrM